MGAQDSRKSNSSIWFSEHHPAHEEKSEAETSLTMSGRALFASALLAVLRPHPLGGSSGFTYLGAWGVLPMPCVGSLGDQVRVPRGMPSSLLPRVCQHPARDFGSWSLALLHQCKGRICPSYQESRAIPDEYGPVRLPLALQRPDPRPLMTPSPEPATKVSVRHEPTHMSRDNLLRMGCAQSSWRAAIPRTPGTLGSSSLDPVPPRRFCKGSACRLLKVAS